jgi:hypothetical protein
MDTLGSSPEMVVVMGGGVLADGGLSPQVVPRCQAVLEMPGLADRAVVVASSSFTLNTPPKLNKAGMPYSEATAIARWLASHGYPGKVVCEQQSHDTVGSVFFVLALYAPLVKARQVHFVTSAFHAERTTRISNFVNERAFNRAFEVKIVAVPDVGVTSERVLHERQSLRSFLDTFEGVDDYRSFFSRFLTEHGNYNKNFGSNMVASTNHLY